MREGYSRKFLNAKGKIIGAPKGTNLELFSTNSCQACYRAALWDNTLRVNRVIFMKRPHLLISCAWLLHAAAWLLPVDKDGVKLPKGLPGWEAFRYASSAMWWPIEGKFDRYYAVLATGSAMTTLLFIFGSPWVVLRGSRSLWRVSTWAAATAIIVNAHWYVLYGSSRSNLRIGYFLWWLSFVVLATGLFDLVGSRRADESKES
jgi:hypothetical protein